MEIQSTPAVPNRGGCLVTQRSRGYVFPSVRRGALLATAVLLGAATVRIAIFGLLHVLSLDAGRGGLSPFVLGGDDGDYYYYTALALAAGATDIDANAYPHLLAAIIGWTSRSDILTLKLPNLAASLLSVALLTRLCATARPRGSAWLWAILLIGLYPSAIAYSSLSLHRDAWLFLLHAASAALASRLLDRQGMAQRGATALLLVCALVTLFSFRWYATAAVIAGLLLSFLSERKALLRQPTAFFVTLALAVTICGIAIVAFASSWDRLGGLQGLAEYRGGYDYEPAGSNTGLNPFAAAWYLAAPTYAYSFASNVFGPFPWQITSFMTLAVAVCEAPVLLAVAWVVWRRRQVLPSMARRFVIQALVWFALISLSNDNIGTATRLRVLGWNLMFVAIGITPRRHYCDSHTRG